MLCLNLVPSWARTNVQTPSGDNARVSWAWKCNPAKILSGQSESMSCTIACTYVWEVDEKADNLKPFIRNF